MGPYNRFLNGMGDRLRTVDEDTTPEAPEDKAHRLAQNLREWSLAFKQYGSKSPEQRQILIDQLKNDTENFPFVKGIHDEPKVETASVSAGADEGMTFHILGKTRKQQAASSGDSDMTFHILGGDKPRQKTEFDQPAPMTTPGELAENPQGAVTGKIRVPAGRNPSRDVTPPSEDGISGRTLGRLGVETAGAFAGGSIGSFLGGAGGLNPATAGVGMRLGEGIGAAGGSLLSEVFDPTPHPLEEAAKAGGFTLGTGLVTSGATGILRRLIGKPSEGGRELLKIMEAKGEVPTPGAVMESEFVKNAQSFGSAAFGTSEKLKMVQEKTEAIASDAVREYISGFQRYHDAARKFFDNIDQYLGHANVGVKGDIGARDAVMDVAENWVNRTGRVDAMPTGLQKMYNWSKNGGPAPTFTMNEVQEVYDALYNKARALDFAARNRDVTELGGTNVAKYVRDQATKVKDAYDQQIDNLIKRGDVPPDTKAMLVAARGNWKLWTEGEELERMLATSTKDIEGGGTVHGTKLLNELDKSLKEDAKVMGPGKSRFSPETRENLRRYAIALKSLEDSEKAGGYVFAGRMGQIAGFSGLATAPFVGGAAVGGAAAFAAIAPHVLSWTFSNPKASALIIRGLKVDPSTAAGMRIGRELWSLWEKEGLVGPDRDMGPQEPVTGNPNKRVPD
jgi:hypothetical protein